MAKHWIDIYVPKKIATSKKRVMNYYNRKSVYLKAIDSKCSRRALFGKRLCRVRVVRKL